ncbi:hypothetical protein FNF31_01014 [Cafeteria roenbergensis]|uniref:Uncharacterized protein n=1 Tax=Cafeteria roenbergensis TaxID=33653 RepID=A0A5A8DPC8_CAFRO|nr:hypothetical protein FNF31_01014 [Cafeteria roenbergensis]
MAAAADAACSTPEALASLDPSAACAAIASSGGLWTANAEVAPDDVISARRSVAEAFPAAALADAIHHGVARVVRADVTEAGDIFSGLSRAHQDLVAHASTAGTAPPDPVPAELASRAEGLCDRSDRAELGWTAHLLLEGSSDAERRAWAKVRRVGGAGSRRGTRRAAFADVSRLCETDALSSEAVSSALLKLCDASKVKTSSVKRSAALKGLIAADLFAVNALQAIVTGSGRDGSGPGRARAEKRAGCRSTASRSAPTSSSAASPSASSGSESEEPVSRRSNSRAAHRASASASPAEPDWDVQGRALLTLVELSGPPQPSAVCDRTRAPRDHLTSDVVLMAVRASACRVIAAAVSHARRVQAALTSTACSASIVVSSNGRAKRVVGAADAMGWSGPHGWLRSALPGKPSGVSPPCGSFRGPASDLLEALLGLDPIKSASAGGTESSDAATGGSGSGGAASSRASQRKTGRRNDEEEDEDDEDNVEDEDEDEDEDDEVELLDTTALLDDQRDSGSPGSIARAAQQGAKPQSRASASATSAAASASARSSAAAAATARGTLSNPFPDHTALLGQALTQQLTSTAKRLVAANAGRAVAELEATLPPKTRSDVHDGLAGLAGPDLPPRAGSALSAGRALLAQLPAATKSLGQRLAASVRDAVSLHAIGAHRTAQSAVPVIVGIDSLQSHSTVKPAQLVRNHLATSLAARYLPSDLRQAELDRAAERRAASHVKAVGCAGVLAAKRIRGSVLKSRAKDLVAKGASADEVDASFEQLGRAFFCPVWFTKESLPVSRSKAAPQQHNSCDCGVWAGANAEAWAVRAALPHVTSADVKEGLTRIVTADWVPRAEVALRREVLASRVWQATVMRPSTAAEYRLCLEVTIT